MKTKNTHIALITLLAIIIATAAYLKTERIQVETSLNTTSLQGAVPGGNYTITISITNTGNRPIKETWTEITTTGNGELERNLYATDHNKTLARLDQPIKTSGKIKPRQTSTYNLNLQLKPETNNHAQNTTLHIETQTTATYNKALHYYTPLTIQIASLAAIITIITITTIEQEET